MPDDDESKQAEIPGYANQRRADFHETGRQAFADGACEQNRLRRAAGIDEPELTRNQALQIADGWLSNISSNSTKPRTKSDLVLVTQVPSDYDDSEITLGKQRAAQLDRLNKQESERRKDITLREVFDDNF